jgi:U3 small nucleolar RNA-associated protein 7
MDDGHLRPKKATVNGARKAKKLFAEPSSDLTANSITLHTSLPKSLRLSLPPSGKVRNYSYLANQRLRAELTSQATRSAQSKVLLKDAGMLLTGEVGKLEVEGELERTWRVGQDEILRSAGQEAARGRRELKLDGGPYRSRFTRNGRYVLKSGYTDHVLSSSKIQNPNRSLTVIKPDTSL